MTRVCAAVGSNGSCAVKSVYQPSAGTTGTAPPAASRRARWSAVLQHDRRRQRVDAAAEQPVEILRDRRADRARRQLLCRAVHRHDLTHVGLIRAQFLMRGHVDFSQQAGARDAAAHEEPVTRAEAAEQVPAAEEFRRDHARVVAEGDGDERKAPVAIEPRQVCEQLLGRLDPKLGKLRHRRRTDAG
jgi:hypothetical protein